MITCTRRIEDACVFLWQAMNGRTRLNACPYELLGCLRVILDVHDRLRLIPSRQDRDLVNNSLAFAYAWVSTPMAQEDVEACVALECRCDAAHRENDQWHRDGEQAHAASQLASVGNPNPEHPFWSILIHIIQTQEPHPVIDVSNSHSSAVHRSKVRTRWPSSLGNFIPHGPKDTVRGLQQWFLEETPTQVLPHIYVIFSSLLQLCHPLVMPHIARSSDFLLHTVIGPIERMNSMYSEETERDTGQWLQLHNFIKALYPFLRNLTKIVGDGTERIMVFNHSPQKLMDGIVCAMKLCTSLSMPASNHCLSKLRGTINRGELRGLFNDYFLIAMEVAAECSTRNALQNKSALHGLILKSSEGARYETKADESSEQSYTVEEQFSRLMVWLRLDEGRVCLSATCDTALSSGTLMKRCGGCERVYYCSRLCQKRAWTDEVSPHRLVCSELRFLRNEYVTPEKRSKGKSGTTARFKSRNPADLDQRAQFVLDHFKKLSEVKMAAATRCAAQQAL